MYVFADTSRFPEWQSRSRLRQYSGPQESPADWASVAARRAPGHPRMSSPLCYAARKPRLSVNDAPGPEAPSADRASVS